MAQQFNQLEQKHIDFIAAQKIFFVGTGCATGPINVSPKGMDSFKVVSPTQALWLNLTGSGNETSVHVQDNGRMTVMFCSFDKQPLILRLYGQASVVHPRDAKWESLAGHFAAQVGARQCFELRIELVQTSCGFAVPYYQYKGDRQALVNWGDKQGEAGIKAYWQEHNQVSLDGRETNILDSQALTPPPTSPDRHTANE